MPKKKPDATGVPADALTKELAELHQMLCEASAAFCQPGEEIGEYLAVTRLFAGLSLEDWKVISQGNALSEWFALPLDAKANPYLAHIRETLAELAFKTEHDPLTNLANRRAFERRLETEITRIAREGTSLSLAVLDLDDFKEVNDTHGHGAGDEVLVALARTLLKNKRPYDMAARLGGEEFAMLLPGAGLHNARAVMERVQKEFADTVFKRGKASFSVTFSAGLTSCRGKIKCTPAELSELADKALYEAKAKGKNAIVTDRIQDGDFAPKRTMVHREEKMFLFAGTK